MCFIIHSFTDVLSLDTEKECVRLSELPEKANKKPKKAARQDLTDEDKRQKEEVIAGKNQFSDSLVWLPFLGLQKYNIVKI